jgi:hypothetical protein
MEVRKPYRIGQKLETGFKKAEKTTQQRWKDRITKDALSSGVKNKEGLAQDKDR